MYVLVCVSVLCVSASVPLREHLRVRGENSANRIENERREGTGPKRENGLCACMYVCVHARAFLYPFLDPLLCFISHITACVVLSGENVIAGTRDLSVLYGFICLREW